MTSAVRFQNLRTAPQSKDQCLSRGNLALKTSAETGFPIRVIRGFKLDSPFAPEQGYRYDGIFLNMSHNQLCEKRNGTSDCQLPIIGLYKCEKAWFTVGMAGYGVWKFALRRIEDQAPPPWTIVSSYEPEFVGGKDPQNVLRRASCCAASEMQ